MRKRLVALLSLAGLASSSTPAASQVLKGSSAGPQTKNESQVKGDKVNQENAAVQDDASKKMRKAGGEQQANKDVVTEKIGPDHIVNKHIAGVKYEKQKTNADAASKDAAKLSKATTENTALQDSQIKKVKTVNGESNAVKSGAQDKWRKAGTENAAVSGEAADKHKLSKATTENTAIQDSQIKKVKTVNGESNAVQSDAAKKYRKAGKDQQDALTVKQKTGIGKTNDSSKGVLIGLSEAQKNEAQKKALKNSAETNAAQQNVEKKVDKATPK